MTMKVRGKGEEKKLAERKNEQTGAYAFTRRICWKTHIPGCKPATTTLLTYYVTLEKERMTSATGALTGTLTETIDRIIGPKTSKA